MKLGPEVDMTPASVTKFASGKGKSYKISLDEAFSPDLPKI